MIDEYDIQQFCSAARYCAASDCDLTVTDAAAVEKALRALLEHCDAIIGVEDDSRYTMTLLDYWICFAQDYGIPGGSKADYCSEAVRKGLRDSWGSVTLRLSDEESAYRLREWIEANAFDPERHISVLESEGIC